MSRIPFLGAEQLGVRWDHAPPALQPRALCAWRAWDGLLAPLNPELVAAYLGRSVTATIYASDGASGTLVASAPAFSSIDWDGDGAREEEALILSLEEAIRWTGVDGDLAWDTGAKTIRHDWIETGDDTDADAPLWSLTNDAATGAYLALIRDAGTVALHHYNGTSTVTSALPVFTGDRYSLRGLYAANGSVRIGLVKNGAAEVLGALSAALLPASEWGVGGGVKARLNEFGSAARGRQALRYHAVYGGMATRRELEEIL